MSPNSIVNWFVAMFRDLEVEGCSSHSGRRTFITVAARRAHQAGCSLRDVQLLAGHRSIEVTQGYIDADCHGQPTTRFDALNKIVATNLSPCTLDPRTS
jgi:integrase/recombinase XerD